MSAVTYTTEAKDWTRALDEAKSLETLRAVVAGWAPYVPDAQAIVDAMSERTFEDWRRVLAMERAKQFSGAEAQAKFGALLLPAALIGGVVVAHTYCVPLGLALIRYRDLGILDRLL